MTTWVAIGHPSRYPDHPDQLLAADPDRARLENYVQVSGRGLLYAHVFLVEVETLDGPHVVVAQTVDTINM